MSENRETTPMLLQKRLSGDLDYILLKALRKEPELRYSSVDQFSEDLHRHLERRPVLARKGTWNYRAGKFIRRNRAAVAAAGLVTATLIAGLVVTLREIRIAEANRRKADSHFNDVRKLANSLIFDVHDSIQTLPGATDSRKLILEKAVTYLDSLAADSQKDTSLMRDLVVGYSRIAELEGNPSFPNLGDTKASLESYAKALSLEEELVRIYPKSETDRLNLAELYENLGEVHMAGTGNISEAVRYSRLSLQILDKEIAKKPDDIKILGRIVSVYRNLGLLQVGNGLSGASGSVTAGIDALEKALAFDRHAMELKPADIPFRGEGAGIQIALGDAYLKLGDRPAAEKSFRESLDIFNVLDPKGENIRVTMNRAVIITKVGDALMIEGKYPQALGFYKEGQLLGEKLLARDPHSETAQSHSIVIHGQVGLALTHLGRFSESNQEFRKSLAASANPSERMAIVRIIRATVGIWFAQSLMHQGKPAEAAAEFAKSKAGFASVGNVDALDLRTRTYLCAAQMQYGGALAAQRKFVQAQKELEPAIAILEKFAGAAPPSQELQYTLAEAYNQEGILFVSRARIAASKDARTADWRAAKSWFEKSSATWDKVKNPARLSTYGLEVSLPGEVSQRIAECNANLSPPQNSSN